MSEIAEMEQSARSGRPATESQHARLRESCRQIEGLFLGQLLAAMERPPWGEGLLGGSSGERIFRSRHTQELAAELGRREALGLSKMLYRELSGQSNYGAPQPAREPQLSNVRRATDHES